MTDDGHHYKFGPPKGGWPSFKEKRVSEFLKKVYLAGPMRGYDQFNFPAFDKGKVILELQKGWQVFSPADHDRELGFDETLNSLDGFDLRASFEWDLTTILRDVDAIVMLPGWERSTGVTRAELPVAQTIGLEVYEITCLLSGNIVQLSEEDVKIRLRDDARQVAYDNGYFRWPSGV